MLSAENYFVLLPGYRIPIQKYDAAKCYVMQNSIVCDCNSGGRFHFICIHKLKSYSKNLTNAHNLILKQNWVVNWDDLVLYIKLFWICVMIHYDALSKKYTFSGAKRWTIAFCTWHHS